MDTCSSRFGFINKLCRYNKTYTHKPKTLEYKTIHNELALCTDDSAFIVSRKQKIGPFLTLLLIAVNKKECLHSFCWGGGISLHVDTRKFMGRRYRERCLCMPHWKQRKLGMMTKPVPVVLEMVTCQLCMRPAVESENLPGTSVSVSVFVFRFMTSANLSSAQHATLHRYLS